MKTKFASLLIALTLTACASAGGSFKWDNARQIKAGMTTAQVVALVGSAPTNVAAVGEEVRYVWVSVNPLTMASKTLRVDFKGDKAISAPPIPDSFKD